MGLSVRVAALFALLSLTLSTSAQTNNEMFVRMIGPEAIMDSTACTIVLRGKPGEKVMLDTNRDSRIDTIYFIDTDDRHENRSAPLLVKVVDEDGDMHVTRSGDLDSDLWIADWQGDGSIDRAVDYIDHDSDGDLDEQVLYQWTDMRHIAGKASRTIDGRAYCAAWGRDYGDDNRLWFDANYEYNQPLTEWKTDFNGDEMFIYMFLYDPDRNRFAPTFENPFSFYNLDGDSYSEEVVRLVGADFRSENLRYSMDIDNDARGSNRHDYDFSLSSAGPVDIPPESYQPLELRGILTSPILKWSHMRQVAKTARWSKTCLTWDENDNNVNPVKGAQHHERWEGIINHPSEHMPQIGGPTCGPYNKRNEVDADHSGGFRFYYSPVDRRLHLFGAEIGWIRADYDYDNTVDMVIETRDRDGDGFFDLWTWDLDADGTIDRSFSPAQDSTVTWPLEYEILHTHYMPALRAALADNRALHPVLKALLRETDGSFSPDPLETYYLNSLASFRPDGFPLGEKIRNSPEGVRYYGDLIRERYWRKLENSSLANESRFAEARRAYESGEHARAAELLRQHIKGQIPGRFETYSKRFTITISNPTDLFLEHHPMILGIAEIRKQFPDFTPADCALTEAEPLLEARPIPVQGDDLDGDGTPDELAFVYSLEPGETVRFDCRYAPRGKTAAAASAKTDARNDWDKQTRANLGWESNRAGFRAYYGQIDFYGKRLDRLILANIEKESYHRVADWGMDALHVGESSGLGGISIWEGDARIPAMNPAGKGDLKITRSVIARGPVRSVVRVDISGIKGKRAEYKVSLRMSSFADNLFSRQEITVTSSQGDSVVYSPGIQKLPNDIWFMDSDAGALTNWGKQEDAIGDIGLGLIYPAGDFRGYAETPLDRLVKLTAPSGKTRTHWVIGGWRKGFPNPVAPSGRDWAETVRELAVRLHAPVKVEYSAGE
ncbi:MAG: DUF4861 family protein [Candidatus Latescibacterota bacterium]